MDLIVRSGDTQGSMIFFLLYISVNPYQSLSKVLIELEGHSVQISTRDNSLLSNEMQICNCNQPLCMSKLLEEILHYICFVTIGLHCHSLYFKMNGIIEHKLATLAKVKRNSLNCPVNQNCSKN